MLSSLSGTSIVNDQKLNLARGAPVTTRPVTRGGSRGREVPLEKCGGHSLKNLGTSRKTL